MGRLSQISPFLLTGANILYRLSNVSWTPGAMAANCKPSTCFCSLSSIWCIMSMKGSRRRENSNLMIISLKAVRNPFCFLQGLQMQIRVTLLSSEMFWKLYVVCEIPISTGSCWDFPLSTGLPNISTGRNPGETPRLVYVGACNGNLWPSGQGGDGGWLVRKWLLFWESPYRHLFGNPSNKQQTYGKFEGFSIF